MKCQENEHEALVTNRLSKLPSPKFREYHGRDEGKEEAVYGCVLKNKYHLDMA